MQETYMVKIGIFGIHGLHSQLVVMCGLTSQNDSCASALKFWNSGIIKKIIHRPLQH